MKKEKKKRRGNVFLNGFWFGNSVNEGKIDEVLNYWKWVQLKKNHWFEQEN